MVTIDVKDFTEGQARHIALNLINEMRDFANVLQKVNPEAEYMYPVMDLEELRERLDSNTLPLHSEKDVDFYFNRLIQLIIKHRPSVRRKLQTFLDAHLDMANISHERGIFYNPLQFIQDNRSKIERVAEMQDKVLHQYHKTPSDEITIYALLFIHIQHTETVAESMINQLMDTLSAGGLLSKYNPGEIFAVEKSFKLEAKTITDGQAIRHALAHNLFDIVFRKAGWEIHFNNDKASEYAFQRIYTGEQFVEFLSRSSYLYQASYIILISIVAGTIIKLRLLR
jgi:hypothetical protein